MSTNADALEIEVDFTSDPNPLANISLIAGGDSVQVGVPGVQFGVQVGVQFDELIISKDLCTQQTCTIPWKPNINGRITQLTITASAAESSSQNPIVTGVAALSATSPSPPPSPPAAPPFPPLSPQRQFSSLVSPENRKMNPSGEAGCSAQEYEIQLSRGFSECKWSISPFTPPCENCDYEIQIRYNASQASETTSCVFEIARQSSQLVLSTFTISPWTCSENSCVEQWLRPTTIPQTNTRRLSESDPLTLSCQCSNFLTFSNNQDNLVVTHVVVNEAISPPSPPPSPPSPPLSPPPYPPLSPPSLSPSPPLSIGVIIGIVGIVIGTALAITICMFRNRLSAL